MEVHIILSYIIYTTREETLICSTKSLTPNFWLKRECLLNSHHNAFKQWVERFSDVRLGAQAHVVTAPLILPYSFIQTNRNRHNRIMDSIKDLIFAHFIICTRLMRLLSLCFILVWFGLSVRLMEQYFT